MKDYVVQSGPLHSFEHLYDSRFEKMRQVADFHTIEIRGRAGTKRRVIAQMNRSSYQEIMFASGFFSAFAKGHHTIFGLRDVMGGKAGNLAKKLLKTEHQWTHMQYGISEDDLVIMELKHFAANVRLLSEFVPPTEGGSFFYLTAAPFDVYQIFWERVAGASLKSQKERFLQDFITLAHQSKIALTQDQEGNFIVLLHPKGPKLDALEKEIEAAGQNAGMDITFAPGLFG